MIIKTDEEGKKLLLDMLDVLVRAQGVRSAQFGVQFPQMIALFTKDEVLEIQALQNQKMLPTMIPNKENEKNKAKQENVPNLKIVKDDSPNN